MSNRTIWISLLEVEPLPGSEYEEWGNAYVNGLVLADTRELAEAQFDTVLRAEGWNLLVAEDTEPLEDRTSQGEVSDEIKQLARLVEQTGGVQFDCFRTWESE